MIRQRVRVDIPSFNLDGLTLLSSTVDEHSLQGSNGFFKGSYNWTEDTSFVVGQPQTKDDDISHSHSLSVQTHRRVVEWYRPGLWSIGISLLDSYPLSERICDMGNFQLRHVLW
jgi:hypothetical protein